MAPLQSGDSGTAAAGEADVRQFVERYVQQLTADGAIRSPAVERAFLSVERHRLLQSFYRPPGPQGGPPPSTTTRSIPSPSTWSSSTPTPRWACWSGAPT